MNIVDRVKNILFSPKTEWDAVRAETAGISQIYTQYLVIVAAFPAVGNLLNLTRLGFAPSLRLAVASYVVSLVGVYVSALIVDSLAPNFKSVKNMTNAFKLVAYAWTPSLVAGLLAFIPALGGLIGLVGILYSIYLFYLGLPALMQTPQDRVIPYMVAAFVVSIVVYIFLFALSGALLGVRWMGW